MRTYLTSNQTFSISPVSGNDANDGQSAPWLTIQHAYEWIRDNIDFGGRSVVVQAVATDPLVTFASAVLRGRPTGCVRDKDFRFTGDLANGWARIIEGGNNPSLFVEDDACCMFEGFSPQANGATAGMRFGVALAEGKVRLGSMGWTNCPEGFVSVSGSRSYLVMEGGHAFLTGGVAALIAELGCTFTMEPGTHLVTINGPYFQHFLLADDCANLYMPPSVLVDQVGIACSGAQGFVSSNAVITRTSVPIPGNGGYASGTGGVVV